ncbi:RecX family transcriptional regulator [Dyadobacter chenwenxiniae]|uniref:Regulatory protein RecX n=1 Tax=Dyadobacter chenwenxiniae TaxID=2906456 RepID=A0A9X1PNV9_9BACT|nr:regulatory protein RecX [Dyadobacter chenwenxiniae]MCF0064216.1 RecX family transcriptional regulator [Dyadobacter chenwenxiniae]UON82568.1 RecX family transcriptional regulator [Dyadobacter chenwenxiniae]
MDRLILQKAASYCAYQERTQDEVRQRLKKWNVWGDEADELIAELISMNYLSEERFAKTYAGGKFRIKNWGRMKIRQELNRRGLSQYSIEKGMGEIEDKAYVEGLKALLEKKRNLLVKTENDPFKLKQKLVRFALGKGYESELIWKTVEELE